MGTHGSRFTKWLSCHVKSAMLIAVGVLGAGGAVAVANVPDPSGVIHSCVTTDAASGLPAPAPNLRIIDSAAPVGTGQTCNAGTEQPLNFNQTGLAGSTGPQGARGETGATGQTGGGACGKPVGHVTLSGSPTISFDVCALAELRTGSAASAGSGKGTKSPTEFEATKLVDSKTKTLVKAMLAGTIFKTAKIDVYSPGTTTVVATLKLSRAPISSDKIALGAVPATETLVLVGPQGKKG